jgi:hypothetical protein
MLGSTMLEVALGMAFIYTLLSLVCSAGREAMESWTKSRSADLERGIRQLLSGEPRAHGAWRWIKETILGHWLDLGDTPGGAARAGGFWRWIQEKALGRQPEPATTNGGGSTVADPGRSVVSDFYRHPLIQSLYSGATGPSYIPTRHFVAAVLDLAQTAAKPKSHVTTLNGSGQASHPLPAPAEPIPARPGDEQKPSEPIPDSGTQPASSPATLDEIVAGIRGNAALPEGLRTAIEALAQQAGGDLVRFKAILGDWFDGTMDRVSGWYKRRTQAILLVIGFAVAVTTNADTIRMADRLARDQGTRASLAGAAEAYGALPEEQRKVDSELRNAVSSAVAQVQQSGVPIGWRDCQTVEWNDPVLKPDCFPGSPAALFRADGPKVAYWTGQWWDQLRIHFFGWLLTALALTLGAPFWFDVLNKIMVIRSTVKPREKSREEGSEDRPAAGTPTLTLKVQGADVVQ